MKKVWTSFEHEIYRKLKAHDLLQKKILICVSGGADSVASLECFFSLLPTHRIEIFHFHHGEGVEFRDEAMGFVKEICQQKGLKLWLRKKQVHDHEFGSKQDEQSLRQYRQKALQEVLNLTDCEVVVTGHHELDLLETRMIRLIRGTGAQGLRSMSEYNGRIFRPFLQVSPEILRQYLQEKKQSWLEDPSNKNPRYLRNWIRHSWLKNLEKKRPGSVHRLSNSLQLLVENSTKSSLQIPKTGLLSRAYYLSLSSIQKAELLAGWLYGQGQMHFNQAQIKEIIKRLDKIQKVFTFKVAGLVFEVNAGQIVVKKP